jgi:hypothetical protein
MLAKSGLTLFLPMVVQKMANTKINYLNTKNDSENRTFRNVLLCGDKARADSRQAWQNAQRKRELQLY